MYALKTIEGTYFTSEIIDDNLMEMGFKPVIEGIIPLDYDEYTMNLDKNIIENENGDFEYVYTPIFSQIKVNKSIITLKQQLSDTDYKVIKNMEAQLVNVELPYDSVVLHAERQALRDKINELEELLKNN
jgi:hypothetical protein